MYNICSIFIQQESFEKIKDIYEEKKFKFSLLIICLFLFFFLSGGRNVYRVITNLLYSPMTRALTDSFLYPLFITYYYFYEKDFINEEDNTQNISLFIINLIISIIIDFCGCVYNDIFILFFCDLEIDTHYVIIDKEKKNYNDSNNFQDPDKFEEANLENDIYDLFDNNESDEEFSDNESKNTISAELKEKEDKLEDKKSVKDENG